MFIFDNYRKFKRQSILNNLNLYNKVQLTPSFFKSVSNYQSIKNDNSKRNMSTFFKGDENFYEAFNLSPSLSQSVKNFSEAPENVTVNSVNYNTINSELDIDKVVSLMTEKVAETMKNCGEGAFFR